MQTKPHIPSPATVIALIALFVALGGTAYGLGRDAGRSQAPSAAASRAAGFGRLRLRAGKIIDTDTTADDGNFNVAFGHATCKRGERLISGGLRQRAGSPGLVAQHIWMVESGPVPKLRQWTVRMNSDLGGAAREDFVVFAYCRS